MAEARRRVHERLRRRARARGALPRSDRAAAAVGKRPARRTVAGGSEDAERAPAGHRPVRASASLPRVVASARRRCARRRRLRGRARDVASSRCARSRCTAARRGQGRGAQRRSRRSSGEACSRVDAAPTRRRSGASRRPLGRDSTASFPHTLRVTVNAERAGPARAPGHDELGRLGARAGDAEGRRTPRRARSRVCGCRRTSSSRSARRSRATRRARCGGVAPIARRASRAACGPSSRATTELTLVLAPGLEIRLGDIGDLRLKLAIARRILRSRPEHG